MKPTPLDRQRSTPGLNGQDVIALNLVNLGIEWPPENKSLATANLAKTAIIIEFALQA